jgi:nucleoside-diphosphate-sugar epimerase
VYNVADPEAFAEAEWARRVAEAAGWTGEVVVVPDEALPDEEGANYHQHLSIDGTRIRRELGYNERVQQDEALRRTVAWERANPPAEVRPEDFDYAAEDAASGGPTPAS